MASVPILYPPKILENLWFFGVFREYEVGLRQCSDYINEAFLDNIGIQPSVHIQSIAHIFALKYRNSHRKCFLRISQNSQENISARVSFFNKVADPATLLKKRLWHRCFPVNFANFFKNTNFKEHLRTTSSENTGK